VVDTMRTRVRSDSVIMMCDGMSVKDGENSPVATMGIPQFVVAL
jgi:hypothetical protein